MARIYPILPSRCRGDHVKVNADAYVAMIQRSVHYSENEWSPGALSTLTDALYAEGQHVKEAGPCAIAIYARLLCLTVTYLRTKPNYYARTTLRERVKADIEVMRIMVWPRLDEYDARCGHYNPPHFSPSELAIMRASYESCARCLEELL